MTVLKINFCSLIICLLCSSACNKQDESVRFAGKAAQYLNEGKFLESKKLMEKAILIKPNVAEYYIGLGFSQIRLSENKEAKISYEKALKIFKKRKSSEHNINQIIMNLILLNRTVEAKQLLIEKSNTMDATKIFPKMEDFEKFSNDIVKLYAIPLLN